MAHRPPTLSRSKYPALCIARSRRALALADLRIVQDQDDPVALLVVQSQIEALDITIRECEEALGLPPGGLLYGGDGPDRLPLG